MSALRLRALRLPALRVSALRLQAFGLRALGQPALRAPAPMLRTRRLLAGLARGRHPSLSVRGLRLIALTTTMTFVFATVIGTAGLVATHGTVALGASTTLSIIRGDVSVSPSAAGAFQAASDGMELRAGMTIRTASGAYAVLTYFDGSTVSVDPSTTLVIQAMSAGPSGSKVIVMEQRIGQTWHHVAKLLTPDSKYEVKTPTATATVRGTMFEVGVAVDPQGEVVSTVATTEGAVATTKAPTPQQPQPTQEVVVKPGYEVTVTKAAPLPQPKLAPPPTRTVTVTVGTASGIVLDPLGRANGIKDGKIVVQTPGAVVKEVNGKVVVRLPDIPDGRVAAVVDPKVSGRAPVEVVTTVADRGHAPETTHEQVTPSASVSAPAVAAIVLKKDGEVVAAPVTTAEKKEIASSVKVADAPKLGNVVTEASAGVDTGTSPSGGRDSNGKDNRDKKRTASGGSGGPGGPSVGASANEDSGGAPAFVPLSTLPAIPQVVASGDEHHAARVTKKTDKSRGSGDRSDRSGAGPGGGAPPGGQPNAAPNGTQSGAGAAGNAGPGNGVAGPGQVGGGQSAGQQAASGPASNGAQQGGGGSGGAASSAGGGSSGGGQSAGQQAASGPASGGGQQSDSDSGSGGAAPAAVGGSSGGGSPGGGQNAVQQNGGGSGGGSSNSGGGAQNAGANGAQGAGGGSAGGSQNAGAAPVQNAAGGAPDNGGQNAAPQGGGGGSSNNAPQPAAPPESGSRASGGGFVPDLRLPDLPLGGGQRDRSRPERHDKGPSRQDKGSGHSSGGD